MGPTTLDRAFVRAIPAVPKAIVRPPSRRYIAGPGLGDALETIRALGGAGRSATVDVLGEQLTTRAQVDALMDDYRRALDAFADHQLDATLSGAFVAVASHDEWIHRRALELVDRHGVGRDAYEFQMLLGVREQLADALIADGHGVPVYVPYGADWHA